MVIDRAFIFHMHIPCGGVKVRCQGQGQISRPRFKNWPLVEGGISFSQIQLFFQFKSNTT